MKHEIKTNPYWRILDFSSSCNFKEESLDHLIEMLFSGALGPNDLICPPDQSQYVTLKFCQEFTEKLHETGKTFFESMTEDKWRTTFEGVFINKRLFFKNSGEPFAEKYNARKNNLLNHVLTPLKSLLFHDEEILTLVEAMTFSSRVRKIMNFLPSFFFSVPVVMIITDRRIFQIPTNYSSSLEMIVLYAEVNHFHFSSSGHNTFQMVLSNPQSKKWKWYGIDGIDYSHLKLIIPGLLHEYDTIKADKQYRKLHGKRELLFKFNLPLYRRKTLFIKKRFQTVFITLFILIILILSITNCLILKLFFPDSTAIIFHNAHLKVMLAMDYLFPIFVFSLVVSSLLASGFIVLLALFFSHRIGGPLYRFEMVLKKLNEGDLTQKVFLRKKDQLQEIAENFNSTLLSLRNKIQSVDEEIKNLEQSFTSEDKNVFDTRLQKTKLILKQIDVHFENNPGEMNE